MLFTPFTINIPFYHFYIKSKWAVESQYFLKDNLLSKKGVVPGVRFQ